VCSTEYQKSKRKEKIMKTAIERFHKIKSNSYVFFKTFGVQLSQFVSPYTGFNIIAFDDYLQNKYGKYEDGKTSMADFIEKKYGMDAVKLIKNLII
jgi:translation initiation factor 2 alpha subunit (eIF-2alpha)